MADAFQKARSRGVAGSHGLHFDESETIKRLSVDPIDDTRRAYGAAPVFVLVGAEQDGDLLAEHHRSPVLREVLEAGKLNLVFLGTEARIPAWADGAIRHTPEQALKLIMALPSEGGEAPYLPIWDPASVLMQTLIERGEGWEVDATHQVVKLAFSHLHHPGPPCTVQEPLHLGEASALIREFINGVMADRIRPQLEALGEAQKRGMGEVGAMGCAEGLLDAGDVLREIAEHFKMARHQLASAQFPSFPEMTAVKDEMLSVYNSLLKQIHESLTLTAQSYDLEAPPKNDSRRFVMRLNADLDTLNEKIELLTAVPVGVVMQYVRARTYAAPPELPYGVSDVGAEYLARDWMRAIGVTDAEVTQFTGDGGIDVVSSEWVAQVKNYRATIGIESVRALAGVAAASGKKPMFFTTGRYPSSAFAFAKSTGMALFRMVPVEGRLEIYSEAAKALVD